VVTSEDANNNSIDTDTGADPDGYFPQIGFSHMASALMAMHHFNTRNPIIVAELGSDPLYSVDHCPIQFNLRDSRFFNDAAMLPSSLSSSSSSSSSSSYQAVPALLQAEYEQAVANFQRQNHANNDSNNNSNSSSNVTNRTNLAAKPCAVIGPYNDIPLLEISTIAASQQFPVTTYRSVNLRATATYASPYTQSVFPEMTVSVEPVIANLLLQNRHNYIAIIYPFTDAGVRIIVCNFVLFFKNEMRNPSSH
jgi:hypothetical protein